jgi:hypothetical protein
MTITPTDATTATARTAVDEEPSTQSEHHGFRLRVHRSGTGNCHVAAHIQDAASLSLTDRPSDARSESSVESP